MIYICIPTHNEQQTVGVVLWKLRQVLTEFHRDYQLLVADDASTDRTTDVLEPYTRVLPLTVIRSETRQGYAASLEMLLREAVRRSEYPKRDVIVTLQADFSEEPDDIVGLIKRMEAGADVAVGIKVGAARDSRLRQVARGLSSFFTRRQTWPEGVVTPFDGYRAYRLHAVKRAMEERGGRRLLRYDGWAGHAELLRAVLPHARRVDALNVEDRPDRLQRPRRERPLQAAWQVRAMASGAEPQGLTSVEELDRIAATASRSRSRSVVENGVTRTTRTAASTQRDRRRPDGRDRDRSRDRSRSPRGERPERGERADRPERPERGDRRDRGGATQRDGQAAGASGEARRERGRGGSRDRRRDEAKPASQVSAGAAAEEADVAAQAGQAEAGAEAAPPKKRRRRRRGKGGSAAAGTAATGAAGAQGAPEDAATRPAGEADRPGDDARRAALDELDALLGGLSGRGREDSGGGRAGGTAEAGEAGGDDAGEGTERKRRRRGGRRGGRGRRRSPRTDAPAEGAAEAASGGEQGAAASDAAGGSRGEPAPVAGLLAPPPRDRAEPEKD